MASQFDINRFRHSTKPSSQYEKQLERLINNGQQVDCIEEAVRGAVKNLREDRSKSFVIYGEPQSGKTEMMICLTGKLLDEGFNFIVHMLNDSVDLLTQNLGRFKNSGLAPSARNFSEILDPDYVMKGRKHVIFCKKNASDLAKLKNKIGKSEKIVVIDDEADYASPNSKVNKGQKTRINELIGEILADTGIYIGVTASNPSSLFTIIIGGNIVSRGVTFNNLLSMFFTRDVKNKIQQDTYIQRARMFGARGRYLKHFELTIPEQLYLDWHRCFVFHKLALAAINAKLGSPVCVLGM